MIPDVQENFKNKVFVGFFIWSKGLANIITTFIQILRKSIGLVYMGSYFESKQLAAFGMAQSWVFCLGISISFGMASGVATMASHAYGAKKNSLVRTILWKGLFVITIFNIIMSVVIAFSSSIFKLIGTEPSTADASAPFLRIQLLHFNSYSYFSVLRFFAQGLGHYYF